MGLSKTCPACKHEEIESAESCTNCSFPFNGTEKERGIHIGRFISEKGVIVDADDSFKRSQTILYAVVILYIINIAINIEVLSSNIFVLLLNVGVVVVITVCGFLIKKSPLLFISIPLILLLTIYTSNYLADPDSISRGLIMKLVIIGSLIYSLVLFVKSEKFKKKYNL